IDERAGMTLPPRSLEVRAVGAEDRPRLLLDPAGHRVERLDLRPGRGEGQGPGRVAGRAGPRLDEIPNVDGHGVLPRVSRRGPTRLRGCRGGSPRRPRDSRG